jgi:hypothetical protein
MTDVPVDTLRRLDGARVLPPMEHAQTTPQRPRKDKNTPKRTSGRWESLNAFIDVTMAGLTPRQTKVWLVLFRDCSGAGVARTAQTYIARRTGLRRPTVSTVIGELVELGLVRVIHAGGLNQGIGEYEVRALVDR